jgi:hypothetical protein
MKRILITLIVLLSLTNTGFSQLTIVKSIDNDGEYKETLKDAISSIVNDNPNIDSTNIESFVYNYKKSNENRNVRFYIFTDRNGYFLDIIPIKKAGDDFWYEITDYREIYYTEGNKIVKFESNKNDWCKISLSDGSYITVLFYTNSERGVVYRQEHYKSGYITKFREYAEDFYRN